mmetsp:Transcript_69636/g.122860  ORF Transcript_69636/g.122860 Transcript_69636/m.122860 type:complete len:310 (+) Transcript_69636:1869-2798(+)
MGLGDGDVRLLPQIAWDVRVAWASGDVVVRQLVLKLTVHVGPLYVVAELWGVVLGETDAVLAILVWWPPVNSAVHEGSHRGVGMDDHTIGRSAVGKPAGMLCPKLGGKVPDPIGAALAVCVQVHALCGQEPHGLAVVLFRLQNIDARNPVIQAVEDNGLAGCQLHPPLPLFFGRHAVARAVDEGMQGGVAVDRPLACQVRQTAGEVPSQLSMEAPDGLLLVLRIEVYALLLVEPRWFAHMLHASLQVVLPGDAVVGQVHLELAAARGRQEHKVFLHPNLGLPFGVGVLEEGHTAPVPHWKVGIRDLTGV